MLGANFEVPVDDRAEGPGGQDFADRPGGEADHDDAGIFGVELLDREVFDHGGDFDRPVIRQRQQAVRRVPAGVDDLPTAHALQVRAPGPGILAAPQLDRHVAAGESPILHRLNRAVIEGASQGARGQQAACLDQAWLEELVVRGNEDRAGRIQRLADLRCVLQVRAERLLAEDRLACPGRRDDRFRVQVMREADIDGVDHVCVNHLLQAGKRCNLWIADLPSEVARSLFRRIGNRHDPATRGVLCPCPRMNMPHPSGADNADPERLHAVFPLTCPLVRGRHRPPWRGDTGRRLTSWLKCANTNSYH